MLTGDPIRDRAGGVREIVGYLVDVTSRQRAALGGCADEAVAAAGASRATIEQAKGALMLAYGLDEHGAFRQLVWQSKQANVKLRDLAERLLASIAAENPTSPETRARLDELLYAAPGRGTRHGPPAQPELRLHTHRRDGAVVVVAEGELDLATAEAFDAGLAAVLRVGGGADTAVLDLRGVTHLGSVAATLIARHERRQARLSRRLLVVARRGGQVARVLEVALPHVKLYQEASAALDAAPGAG